MEEYEAMSQYTNLKEDYRYGIIVNMWCLDRPINRLKKNLVPVLGENSPLANPQRTSPLHPILLHQNPRL